MQINSLAQSYSKQNITNKSSKPSFGIAHVKCGDLPLQTYNSTLAASGITDKLAQGKHTDGSLLIQLMSLMTKELKIGSRLLLDVQSKTPKGRTRTNLCFKPGGKFPHRFEILQDPSTGEIVYARYSRPILGVDSYVKPTTAQEKTALAGLRQELQPHLK
jgi:hypothetical protein